MRPAAGTIDLYGDIARLAQIGKAFSHADRRRAIQKLLFATRPTDSHLPSAERLDLEHPWPLLPMPQSTLFPGAIERFPVARPSSMRTVEAASRDDKLVLVGFERASVAELPAFEDLHPVAVTARILEVDTASDQTYLVRLHGLQRVELCALDDSPTSQPYLTATASPLDAHDSPAAAAELEAEIAAFLASPGVPAGAGALVRWRSNAASYPTSWRPT